MSEHDFLSLGVPLGTSRLTISASSVAAMVSYLYDLNEVDETNPEGMSPINDVLDHINTINAAVTVKMPQFTPQAAPSASRPGGFNQSPPVAPTATPDPNSAPSCTHGVMTFRSGTTKSGPNVGKPYSAYFCPAPRGTVQCKPVFN